MSLYDSAIVSEYVLLLFYTIFVSIPLSFQLMNSNLFACGL